MTLLAAMQPTLIYHSDNLTCNILIRCVLAPAAVVSLLQLNCSACVQMSKATSPTKRKIGGSAELSAISLGFTPSSIAEQQIVKLEKQVCL